VLRKREVDLELKFKGPSPTNKNERMENPLIIPVVTINSQISLII
jgi:hypothetical protein